jgi:hypothetical protein
MHSVSGHAGGGGGARFLRSFRPMVSFPHGSFLPVGYRKETGLFH